MSARYRNATRTLICTACLIALAGTSAQAEDRTITGVGNSLQQPNRGAAGTPFIRFGYPTEYVDGVGNLVLSDTQRANARSISNAIAVQTSNTPNSRNLS